MAHRRCLHALTRHATALVSLNTPINPPFSAAVSFKTVTTSQLDTRTHWSVSRRFSSSKSDDEKEESRGESSNGEEIDDDNTAKDDTVAYINKQKPPIKMYGRLLNLASGALAGKPKESNGYILVSANGGLNQQRVAICNAVAVASLLNSTLVLPRFLYSNVWKDPSLVISTKEHFMNMLKDEINIIKELPPYMKSIDIEAIGSLITDADFMKEATPIDYVKKVLPFLVRNGIVHFLGFGNRLGFDPLPSELQRLRCKCNFHALKFVPKIQQAGALLVRRIRKYDSERSMLDKQLLGNFIPNFPSEHQNIARGLSSYLALHLRFEEDMVAYSQCDFGGGKDEQKELQAYREIHFTLLMECLKISKPISPMELRKLRRCPLTPEEAALLLSGLGFKGGTYIYLAGSSIYIWRKITDASVHKPLSEFGHQGNTPYMAALDFIACATADVFAMTDSGSQLSSLVSGFRTYYCWEFMGEDFKDN
ncbi:hypothetical protein Q3G72_020548 [Acer saccharum]|nr:hypothetical protein Q3G72_020548 [Acer saccharum]